MLLFFISLQYEQASPERTTLLIVLFTLFLGWGLIRARLGSFFWLFYIDAILLLLLDYQSRFVVNYFIHSIYFLVIIEAGLVIRRKYLNRTIIPIIIMALSKYIYLLYYQINARSLSEALFHLFALLFMLSLFHYVQLQKEAQAKHELLYKELLSTHRQLKSYMEEAEQVTVLRERNRIGREIHDSVGHELTALIMQLEMSLLSMKHSKSLAEVEALVLKARDTARSCLSETRNAIYTLNDEHVQFLEAIKTLVHKLKYDQRFVAELSIDSKVEELNFSEEENKTLYRVIQEALTNAMRHSATKEASISIQLDQRGCLVFIIKNSVVKNHWKDGFGISNMKARLDSLGGSISVMIQDGEFITRGELPLARRIKE